MKVYHKINEIIISNLMYFQESNIKLENEVQMRRHYSITSDRLSDITITPE